MNDMKDYYDVPAMSASAIKQGAISMKHMHHYMTSGGTKTTPAMRTGTLLHMAILEPERFEDFIVVDGDRRCKDYKDAVAEFGEGGVILETERVACIRCRDSVMEHEAARKWIDEPGTCEKSYYWEHGGHACKARLDKFCYNGTAIEYKTTGSLGRFASTAAGMFYHLQLGWYSCAAETDRMVVIAQEASEPFDVAVFTIRPVQLKMWYRKALSIAERYWSGDRSGAYPEPLSFELPSWAEDDSVSLLTIDERIEF